MLLAQRDRRGRRVRRSGRRHRRRDSALRQDQADHQPARLSQDARQPRRDSRPAGDARCRHRQDRHDGQHAARQSADAAADARTAKVPTVGMCMGDIGTPSRILAGKFGAPFTFATFHHERTLAPGQLSFQQMTDIYHYDRIERRDGGVRRDRRSDRPQPQPDRPQRGLSPAGHQRRVRAVSRAARAPGAVSGRRAGAGHQGPERDDSAQGSRAQEARRKSTTA